MKLLLPALLMALLFSQGCSGPESAAVPSEVEIENQFSDFFQAALQSDCMTCHSGENPIGIIDLSTYANILNSGSVVPGNSEASSLYTEVFLGTMPPSGGYDPAKIDIIREWIDDGARDDNGVAANEPPVVNAGLDASYALPLLSIILSGSATDQDGSIASYLWTQTSGPNTATLTNPGSASASIADFIVGTYVFTLTVADNGNAVATDSVVITVTPFVNSPPFVNAGLDQSITLPTNSASIVGVASDSDGTIALLAWTQVSGPSVASLTGAATLNLTAGTLIAGTYIFQLQATDNLNAVSTDTIQVIVAPAVNIPPLVNAGLDQSITLPTNSASIVGTASDSDGTIALLVWTQVSGPSVASLTGAATLNLTAGTLIEGIYVFQLQATDNLNAVSTDTIQVTVEPPVPTFTQLQANIFVPKCFSCHGGGNAVGGYTMDTHADTVTEVIPGNAAGSVLFVDVDTEDMPRGGGIPLTTTEKEQVRDWINAGALNN